MKKYLADNTVFLVYLFQPQGPHKTCTIARKENKI